MAWSDAGSPGEHGYRMGGDKGAALCARRPGSAAAPRTAGSDSLRLQAEGEEEAWRGVVLGRDVPGGLCAEGPGPGGEGLLPSSTSRGRARRSSSWSEAGKGAMGVRETAPGCG